MTVLMETSKRYLLGVLIFCQHMPQAQNLVCCGRRAQYARVCATQLFVCVCGCSCKRAAGVIADDDDAVDSSEETPDMLSAADGLCSLAASGLPSETSHGEVPAVAVFSNSKKRNRKTFCQAAMHPSGARMAVVCLCVQFCPVRTVMMRP